MSASNPNPHHQLSGMLPLSSKGEHRLVKRDVFWFVDSAILEKKCDTDLFFLMFSYWEKQIADLESLKLKKSDERTTELFGPDRHAGGGNFRTLQELKERLVELLNLLPANGRNTFVTSETKGVLRGAIDRGEERALGCLNFCYGDEQNLALGPKTTLRIKEYDYSDPETKIIKGKGRAKTFNESMGPVVGGGGAQAPLRRTNTGQPAQAMNPVIPALTIGTGGNSMPTGNTQRLSPPRASSSLSSTKAVRPKTDTTSADARGVQTATSAATTTSSGPVIKATAKFTKKAPPKESGSGKFQSGSKKGNSGAGTA